MGVGFGFLVRMTVLGYFQGGNLDRVIGIIPHAHKLRMQIVLSGCFFLR